jgi:uncharacterized protein (DUF433 family)
VVHDRFAAVRCERDIYKTTDQISPLISGVPLEYYETMKEPIITSSSDLMGGTPVFAGTRVPAQTLLDYLKGGESIDDFLEGFPTVSKDQIIAFLEEAEEQIIKMVA